VWEEVRGRKRGKVERLIQRRKVESECVKVWQGERGRHIWGVESVCVCVSVGGRERKRKT
jgi:hypothetical protein